MNPEDVYEAVRAGVADALEKAAENSRRIMHIEAFDAVDDGEAPVRVIGIVDNGEHDLEFVCITTDGEEMFPVIHASVWPPLKRPQDDGAYGIES